MLGKGVFEGLIVTLVVGLTVGLFVGVIVVLGIGVELLIFNKYDDCSINCPFWSSGIKSTEFVFKVIVIEPEKVLPLLYGIFPSILLLKSVIWILEIFVLFNEPIIFKIPFE